MKKKLKSDPKPKSYYQELEKQLREEALNRPLDYSNKGFKMLEKMGFKSNKTNETVDEMKPTVCEPIRIELKNDRKGLGSEKSVNKRQKIVCNKVNDKVIEENFLNHNKSKNQLFFIEKDLKTCQKVCHTLDLESGVDENEFRRQTLRPQWFWPMISTDNEEKGDNEEESVEDLSEEDIDLSPEQKLNVINEYLRNNYYYCIWCGIKFNDSNDINENCLGDTRDKHQ